MPFGGGPFGGGPFGGSGGGGPSPPVVVLDLREGLTAFLEADSDLAAIVADRVRPGVFNESDIERGPSIAYQVLSDASLKDLDGPTGVREATVALHFWSREDVGDCVAAKRRTDEVLDGFSGDMGGVEVLIALQDEEQDLPLEPDDASDLPYYHLSSQFFIRYEE